MTDEDEEFHRIEREAGMRKETVKEHMTKDTALKLALEALDIVKIHFTQNRHVNEAITAIKQALTAPVQERNFCERCGKRLGSGIHTCTPPVELVQEPVAWNTGVPSLYPEMKDGETISVEYTTPPAAPVQEPDTYGYAKRLAEAIWEEHYKSTAPQWKPLGHLIGVITQIDNMTSGLITPPAAQRQWVGLTDEEIATAWPYELGRLEKQFAINLEAKLKEKNT